MVEESKVSKSVDLSAEIETLAAEVSEATNDGDREEAGYELGELVRENAALIAAALRGMEAIDVWYYDGDPGVACLFCGHRTKSEPYPPGEPRHEVTCAYAAYQRERNR